MDFSGEVGCSQKAMDRKTVGPATARRGQGVGSGSEGIRAGDPVRGIADERRGALQVEFLHYVRPRCASTVLTLTCNVSAIWRVVYP